MVVTHQIRFQVGVMCFLYVGLLTFSTYSFGFINNLYLYLASLLLFCLGLIVFCLKVKGLKI